MCESAQDRYRHLARHSRETRARRVTMSLLPLGPSSVSSSLGLPSALSAPVGARNVRTEFSQVVFITADVAGGQSTTEIFLTSDRFKMFGVNAKSKTTEMIKVHP